MNKPPIHLVRVEDHSRAYSVTEELLSTLGIPFATLSDTNSGAVVRQFHFDTVKEAEKLAAQLRKIPPEWRSLGVSFETITVSALAYEDWAETWKKHFGIQHPARNIVIKPSWLDYSPSSGEVVIELDPGMCFGTGRHPTTVYCLEALARFAEEGKKSLTNASFLDAGCGSGILSIAAWKLGFKYILGFDHDPDAINNSRANLDRNGVPEEAVTLVVSDAESFAPGGKQYDFVAANMLANALKKSIENLAKMVKPNGVIAIAGTLTGEYPEIKSQVAALGFREIGKKQDGEWTSGALLKEG